MESRNTAARRAMRVLLYRIARPLTDWRRRAHSRALLRRLTARELRDIGLSRADVLNYLAAMGQPFRDDATNADLAFTLPVAEPDGSIGLGGFNVHDLLFAGKFAPLGGLIVGDV